VYENGFCSCYVGKEGRCKHIVGLLLWFKKESTKFSQSTLSFSQEPSKSNTLEPVLTTNDTEKDATLPEHSVSVIEAPMLTETPPTPSPSLPARKKVSRVLPKSWMQQVEDKKGTSRKRKHETTLLDSTSREEEKEMYTVAENSNGQRTNRRSTAKGKGAVVRPFLFVHVGRT
jgi:hypothetical protein